MPYVSPSRSDVHVNRPLTNISVAFTQKASAFIADRAFPNIPVQKQSDRYFVIKRDEFNRDDMQMRAPATESSGGTYTIDNTPSYFADVWAHHKDIPDQIRSNADDPLNPDREATEFLTTRALVRREVLWAANFFTTSKWTGDQTGVAAAPGANQFLQWNDANSDPIIDLRKGQRAVHASTGFRPNKLVLARDVWDTLADHPDLVARINQGQTTGVAKVMLETLANLLELDEVLVMDAVKTTSAEGQTLTTAFIGSKAALLLYVPPNPGIMTPAAGYTFSWNGYLGASTMGMRIKRFRMEQLASDRVEIEQAFAQKLVSADLGKFFASAIA